MPAFAITFGLIKQGAFDYLVVVTVGAVGALFQKFFVFVAFDAIFCWHTRTVYVIIKPYESFGTVTSRGAGKGGAGCSVWVAAAWLTRIGAVYQLFIFTTHFKI